MPYELGCRNDRVIFLVFTGSQYYISDSGLHNKPRAEGARSGAVDGVVLGIDGCKV